MTICEILCAFLILALALIGGLALCSALLAHPMAIVVTLFFGAIVGIVMRMA